MARPKTGKAIVRKLTASDWVEAALDAVASGGLATLSIERLALSLDATKGSFYWHFANRDALIDAALAAWELSETDVVRDQLSSMERAEDQLRALMRSAFDDRRGARIEGSLLADSDDPRVAEVLRRATQRREAILRGLFEQADVPSPSHRALLGYSAYLGMLQMRRSAPQVVPTGRKLDRFIDFVIERLVD
jgi:AcrR family transcriptional regulator